MNIIRYGNSAVLGFIGTRTTIGTLDVTWTSFNAINIFPGALLDTNWIKIFTRPETN